MLQKSIEIVKLLTNKRMSRDELRAMQNRKLRAIVRHAYDRVPYYRELFDSVGLSPADIASTEDLWKIPITEKEQLRAAVPEKAVTKGTDLSSCSRIRTCGSMGKPFDTFVTEQEKWMRRMLGFRRQLDVGMRPWDRLCIIRNPAKMSGKRYRTLCLSPALPVGEQITSLRKMQPTLLKAWPSVISTLMHHSQGRLGEYIAPRAVITSGEVCDDVMKKKIREGLRAEAFQFYAAGEFGPIASECGAHRGMHLNADQLIMEVVPDPGSAPRGKRGSAVLTSLYGFAMPFIRYRLGDITSILPGHCSCGSSFPLIEPPSGRRSEVIRLPEGRARSVTGLFGASLTPVDGVDQFRVVQEGPTDFVLQVASREKLSAEVAAWIRERITAYLGLPIQLDIQRVEFISSDGEHKFQRFVSKMDGFTPEDDGGGIGSV